MVAPAVDGGDAVRQPLLALLLLSAVACRGTLSPLSNRLKVGEESYVIFVADGEDGLGDLFASAPTGGTSYQVTFTRVDERLPALSPDGAVVAFLRGRAPGDSTSAQLVLLNLLNGAERRTELPLTTVSALGWSRNGSALYLRSTAGLLRAAAPPGDFTLVALPAADSADADSALAILLGDPPVGRLERCPAGGLCARLDGDGLTLVDSTGTAPVHWSGDSAAYVVRGEYQVRPLAGGHNREIRWTHPLPHVRELTYFRGVARADTSSN